jgi:hypothetical protein
VIGSAGLCEAARQESGETDVTFYDLKKGETVITMIEPSRYPEKIQSLYYAASFGDYAVLVVEKIDQYLGESLLMITPAHKGGHDHTPQLHHRGPASPRSGRTPFSRATR